MSATHAPSVAVELLTFEGCPNAEPALASVRETASRLGIRIELRTVDVSDSAAAQRERFLGSPTVRVEGRDVEPAAEKRNDFALGCRVYRTDDGITGIPPERWLREALARAGASRGEPGSAGRASR